MPDTVPAGASCPRCDAALAPPGRFCTGCGTSVGAPSAPDPDVAVTAAVTVRPAAPPPASGRGATRACVSCGALNARSRELCGACGLDLDPMDRTAVLPRGPVEGTAATSPRGDARRWWRWIPAALGAVLLVAGAIVGGLALAEVGPFTPVPEPLPPLTPPDAADLGPEVELPVSDVGALTTAAPGAGRSFTPLHLVDGDPTTAWRAAGTDRPEGVEETLDLVLTSPAWVQALVLGNGDHHSVEDLAASGHATRVALHFDGDQVVVAELLDLGRQRQRIDLDVAVLTTAVRITILAVTPGTDHPDPAFSSMEVRGHPADAADAARAIERAAERPAAGAVVIETLPRSPLSLPGRGSGG